MSSSPESKCIPAFSPDFSYTSHYIINMPPSYEDVENADDGGVAEMPLPQETHSENAQAQAENAQAVNAEADAAVEVSRWNLRPFHE